MKWIMFVMAAALTAGAVVAQQPPPPPPDSEQGEALQERLRERARRIPASGLAAALRAATEGRSERAQTLPGAPDLAILRAELARTEQEDAARQRASIGLLATGPSVRREPALPAPGLRTLDPATLSRVARAEVERVRVPVLVPAVADLRDKIRVYGQENAYTATARLDAETLLSISGTCHRVIGGDPDVVAFRKRLAESPPRLPGTDAPYYISRNPLGVDISFSKFGCGYVMTVECGDPDKDPRCAEDDYVVGLADSMVLINPALAGGE